MGRYPHQSGTDGDHLKVFAESMVRAVGIDKAIEQCRSNDWIDAMAYLMEMKAKQDR